MSIWSKNNAASSRGTRIDEEFERSNVALQTQKLNFNDFSRIQTGKICARHFRCSANNIDNWVGHFDNKTARRIGIQVT